MTHCIRKSICDSPLLSWIHQYFLRNFDNLLQYLSYVPSGHDMTPIFSIVRKHLLFTLRNIHFFLKKKKTSQRGFIVILGVIMKVIAFQS